MLSTVMQIGSIIALIGGTAYFFFQYMPYLISWFNSFQDIFYQLSESVPFDLQPFIGVGLALSAFGLIVKLL